MGEQEHSVKSTDAIAVGLGLSASLADPLWSHWLDKSISLILPVALSGGVYLARYLFALWVAKGASRKKSERQADRLVSHSFRLEAENEHLRLEIERLRSQIEILSNLRK